MREGPQRLIRTVLRECLGRVGTVVRITRIIQPRNQRLFANLPGRILSNVSHAANTFTEFIAFVIGYTLVWRGWTVSHTGVVARAVICRRYCCGAMFPDLCRKRVRRVEGDDRVEQA